MYAIMQISSITRYKTRFAICAKSGVSKMAKTKQQKSHEEMKRKVLLTAAKTFMEKGYTETTLRGIAQKAGVNIGSLINLFNTKEDILSELVAFVLEEQFDKTSKLIGGMTKDKILFYAAETTLQLYMAESHESIRSLYAAAYSMPKSSAVIQSNITGKLEYIFKEHLPDLKTQDFYKLEIATGGIMRGFMTVPCNMWFTMEQKVEAFLETSLSIYRIGEEKIREAIEFVSRFDYPTIAQRTIDGLFAFLEVAPTDEEN